MSVRCAIDNNIQDNESKAEALGICSMSWPIFGVVWPSSILLSNASGSLGLFDVIIGSDLLYKDQHIDL